MTGGADFAREADRLRAQEFARLADAAPPTLDALRSLTPGPFREAVATMFERLGYAVMTHGNAEYLMLTKDGHKYIVMCAAPAYAEPTRIQTLARLHATLTAASAQAGYCVTTRTFTPDAHAYAATAPLHLVDGAHLVAMMQESKAGAILPETYDSLCRQCGARVQHRLDQADAVPCAQDHLVAPTIARAALDGQREPSAAAVCRSASPTPSPSWAAPIGLIDAVSPVSSQYTEVTAMRHIAREINPREAGLTPYCVQFTREESPPVRSLLEEGIWYTHPAHEETAIVWAKDADAIPDVLTYHYRRSWRNLTMLEPTP